MNYILLSVDVIGILVVGFFFSLSVYKNQNMCIYNEVISQKKNSTFMRNHGLSQQLSKQILSKNKNNYMQTYKKWVTQ